MRRIPRHNGEADGRQHARVVRTHRPNDRRSQPDVPIRITMDPMYPRRVRATPGRAFDGVGVRQSSSRRVDE